MPHLRITGSWSFPLLLAAVVVLVLSGTRPAPAASAYDVAADLAAREDTARQNLGEKVHLARIAEVFLVVGATSMRKAEFDRSLSFTKKTITAYMNGRFARLPERAVEIYLFPSKKPYEAFCKKYYNGCGTPYGVYFAADRRIVMNIGPGRGTLSHELVHPIVEVDFPGAPDWINEGIASLFEYPNFTAPGEVHGHTNWRRPRLVQALRAKDERHLAALDRLFGMSDEVFRGDYEDLHYAMARYLCQWLDEKDLLWKFYQTWRDDFADDPTGKKTFAAVVGSKPEEVQAAWETWVKGLR